MGTAGEPPGASGRSGAAARVLGCAVLVTAAIMGALFVAWWLEESGLGQAPIPHHRPERSASGAGARPAGASSPAPARTAPAPSAPTEDAIAAALREERVSLESGVVIEGFDRDRAWVCAGESIGLSARVGGQRDPDAVQRWVWLGGGGGAELQPGPTLRWRAPAKAGRYTVRFQVCKDLGGRRVGVLAERELEIEVRSCGEGEGQDVEPLRIDVSQRGNATFSFRALYQGREEVSAYAWDFGDGNTRTTTGPTVDHTYAIQGLGPQEIRSFTVKLEARLARGAPIGATAFALTRGQPPAETPPVRLEISRWRPRPGGEGWRSDVVVRPSTTGTVTWDRLERVTLHRDGRVDVATRRWTEVIVVEERLDQGGFRGHVRVDASEVPPDVKQLIDTLYGRDVTGKEVAVSWTPFKREASPTPGGAVDMPPGK